ncbi:hypothetical protein A9Q84_20740 [Halobacteriovorax marinus]|uniref:Ribosomal RNA small subunit methyltransferase G n=1 Tax=Halobacteriovorax marinus TaxID=97084 RepID=A0A1Y5F1C2_9BACT|nr:hypothetical protein A9Q84_20740 [Halobacteriovorax marinus]
MKEFAQKYLDLLTGEYSGINLTRITTFEEFYSKQIVDSILPLEASKIFKDAIEKTSVVVDVGFGGGFPILPLAFLYPEKKFVGFEARAKKAKVVQEIAEKLGLKNVKCYHHRVETIKMNLPVVVTFKAVGTVEDFAPKLNFTKDSSLAFFYKGPSFYEKENIESVEKNWKIIEECFYDLEGTEGRMLIGLKNKIVPRRTKKEWKNLVNLSDLI